MRPTVISPTIQEFDGTRYYLCGKYFQRKGIRLHIKVWEYHSGSVPVGCHVHHKDENRSHNDFDNLECLTIQAHLGCRHGEASALRGKRSIAKAIAAAGAWHRTDEGRAWHSTHFKQNILPTMERRIPAVCEECGNDYLVSAARVEQGKFCGPNCRARALRKRRKRERSG